MNKDLQQLFIVARLIFILNTQFYLKNCYQIYLSIDETHYHHLYFIFRFSVYIKRIKQLSKSLSTMGGVYVSGKNGNLSCMGFVVKLKSKGKCYLSYFLEK